MRHIITTILLRAIAQACFCYQNATTIVHWVYLIMKRGHDRIIKDYELDGNVAIVSSYQSAGTVSFRTMIFELRKQGFKVLVVSNGDQPQGSIEGIIGTVDGLIVRRNVGRDFGAYKSGMIHLMKRGYINRISNIILVNDSILFPVIETDSFWKRIFDCDADVVGVFESFTPRHHLQSYFLMLRENVVRSQSMLLFWKNYRIWNSRRHAVYSGEIGFSRHLKRGGFRLGAIVNAGSALAEMGRYILNQKKLPNILEKSLQSSGSRKHLAVRALELALEKSNPSHILADFSVSNLGIPMMKKDLVLRGTMSLAEVAALCSESTLTIPATEILSTYRSKGLPAEMPAWRRFLISIGVQ